jgi:hypothetical protein
MVNMSEDKYRDIPWEKGQTTGSNWDRGSVSPGAISPLQMAFIYLLPQRATSCLPCSYFTV